MRDAKEKELDQGASETTGQPAQGKGTIEDLSPDDREANDVRGGALPPNDVKLGVLPPDGIRDYLVPPST